VKYPILPEYFRKINPIVDVTQTPLKRTSAGTSPYLAEEDPVFCRKFRSCKADVFSLGALMSQALSPAVTAKA